MLYCKSTAHCGHKKSAAPSPWKVTGRATSDTRTRCVARGKDLMSIVAHSPALVPATAPTSAPTAAPDSAPPVTRTPPATGATTLTLHEMARTATAQITILATIAADLDAARVHVAALEAMLASQRDTVRCVMRFIPGSIPAGQIATIAEHVALTYADQRAMLAALAIPCPVE